jgi:uncharacterized protein (DUF1800 family)
MDRRKFLIGSGATIAAAAGLSKAENAFAANNDFSIPRYSARGLDADPQPLITQSNDLTPYSGAWTDTTLRHLLRRAMFGVPLAQFQAAQALGSMSAVVDKLLSDLPLPPKPAPYVDLIAQPDAADLADPNYGKYIAGQDAQRLETMRQAQVVNWWMDLIVKENLSIREHMTLLWSNHFVTGTDVVPLTALTYTYNQMLRRNALGNMKSFVHDVSVDPAMLIYLNGNQNYDGTPPGGTRGGKGLNINENYARELQELFTMGIFDPDDGVTPNYSENDVQQAAKALTGWGPTATAPFQGVFYPPSHNIDQKTYLGQTGYWALDDIINIIFTYKGPNGNHDPGYTAAYWFCQKIYMEFVYYVPNPDVVKAMAVLMLKSNWEVKPVLQALLESDHFYDPLVQNAQLKSPVNFVASLIREFGLTYTPFDPADPPWDGTTRDANKVKKYTDPNPTLTFLALSASALVVSQLSLFSATALGQELLQPPNVKGWPGGHNWISTGTFQQRQFNSTSLLANPIVFDGGTKARGAKIEFLDPVAWANQIPNSSTMKMSEIAVALSTHLLNRALGPNETAALYQSINPLGLPDSDNYLDPKNVSPFAIALAQLPEFQLV